MLYYLENIDYNEVKNVSVTTPETPPDIQNMLDKVNSKDKE